MTCLMCILLYIINTLPCTTAQHDIPTYIWCVLHAHNNMTLYYTIYMHTNCRNLAWNPYIMELGIEAHTITHMHAHPSLVNTHNNTYMNLCIYSCAMYMYIYTHNNYAYIHSYTRYT